MEGRNMNIAKEYFKKQQKNEEFRHSYLEEKVTLDIEYRLEELKRDITDRKPQEELIRKVDLLEKYVLSA
jgi:hypothetical protein